MPTWSCQWSGVMTMPVSFHIRPQDQEERVPSQEAEDHTQMIYLPLSLRSRGVHRCHLHLLLDTLHQQHSSRYSRASYSAHHSPKYIHASSREIAGVMDAILLTCSYTGCPGSEVYADTDYDPPGSSSCSWSARGAHH